MHYNLPQKKKGGKMQDIRILRPKKADIVQTHP